MSKFEVGQRVRVYQGSGDFRGTVTEVEPLGLKNVLRVKFDKYYSDSLGDLPHVNQCRRLRKKRKPKVVEFESEVRTVINEFGHVPYVYSIEMKGLESERVKVRVEEILEAKP